MCLMEVHAHVERGTFAEFLRAESSCPLAILLPQSLSSWDDGHMSLHLAESSCPCVCLLFISVLVVRTFSSVSYSVLAYRWPWPV